MSIKRIEMDWSCGTDYSLFYEALRVAISNQCDDVVFEFNGGKFSVSSHSEWNDITYNALHEFPRQDREVKL